MTAQTMTEETSEMPAAVERSEKAYIVPCSWPAPTKAPTVGARLGRYGIGCSKQEWQVWVMFGDQGLTELWPEDQPPPACIRDLEPSRVVEYIAERLDETWSTDHARRRGIVAWARAHAVTLDALWAERRLEGLRAEVAEMEELVARAARLKAAADLAAAGIDQRTRDRSLIKLINAAAKARNAEKSR